MDRANYGPGREMSNGAPETEILRLVASLHAMMNSPQRLPVSERPNFRFFIRRAGDPAPTFRARSASNPSYAFDSAAGRNIVLCFFGSTSHETGRSALEAVARNRAIFDDDRLAFFGVSVDPADEAQGRIRDAYPGIRFFHDHDGAICKLYGALPAQPEGVRNLPFRCVWVVIDPTLRILNVLNFDQTGENHEDLFAYLRTLPPPGRHAGIEVPTPILVLPNVFDADFCKHLIGLYDTHGGEETGFMIERDGKTVGVLDHSHKRRRDYMIEDDSIMQETQKWVQRRIIPEILKVHQFRVTRMERYMVGCYTAEDRGHFRPHRDNTTRGTAHRRFACSIALNDDYDGGEVGFPEYGSRTFKAPAGGAVVFSCSLLHMVTPVTRGRRYVFLPFLYDDAAAEIRERNNTYLSEEIQAYDPNKKFAA